MPVESDAIRREPGPIRELARKCPELAAAETVLAAAIANGAGEQDVTWWIAAETAMQRLDFKTARERIGKCLEIHPINSSCHNLLGQLELRFGNVPEAASAFRASMDFWPEYIIWYAKGLWREGRTQQSLATIDRAIFLARYLGPNLRIHSMRLKAEFLLEMGETEAANQIVNELLALKDELTMEGWYMLTWRMPYLLGKLDRHEEAKAITDRMESETTYVDPFFFAIGHLGAGETDKALDAIEAGLDVNPYFTGKYMRTPQYFGELKDHPRFKRLLARLEELEKT